MKQPVVAPALMIASTDSTHYQDITETTYRFCPLRIHKVRATTLRHLDARVWVHACVRACVRVCEMESSDGPKLVRRRIWHGTTATTSAYRCKTWAR